jgi:hypothetical protein
MKVILENGMVGSPPVYVPTSSYADARKLADVMAQTIMSCCNPENWTYEWLSDRHAIVHHAAYDPECRVDITITGSVPAMAARRGEQSEV